MTARSLRLSRVRTAFRPFDHTAPIGADKRPLGKSGFKRHLLALLTQVNNGFMRNIVVVGDNDDDHASNFEEVRKAFREAKGYPTPPIAPCEIAEIERKVRVGIVMLPAAGRNGCLDARATPIQLFAIIHKWLA